MGAQWKHAGKAESSNKRGAIISKLVKEIIVASKLGGPDPDHNSRLRAGIEAAKKQSVPRDNIERAIKKGAGLLDEAVVYETVTYEGFAPHKVPIIIECLTDNKARSASNIRTIFNKLHGQLGTPGSVGWQFDRWGLIEAVHPSKDQDLETVAIEAGAENVEPLEKQDSEGQGARFFTQITQLDTVTKALEKGGWKISQAELGYAAKNFTEVNEAQKKEVIEFLNEIDDDDDVHRVYAALK
ncbi:MAG: YebC/PmpR family DNA-binding transcriptional regulator [Bdellovibrionales bacterium]|nr:YebC/PmpR family DNA-binding transcriptional regulator [Bdellovibrionales bacterium]